ncbi:ATP-binding protein [Rheinheimera sp.]|uniref:ATP-binding protein n=1 Tax=Rheinheimera sp. TaxID=1869214 RepID=UPI002FDD2A8A
MKKVSFQHKVFWGFVLVALLSLVLVVLPVLWNISNQFQLQLEAYNRSQSKVLADMSAAAMMFDQADSASSLLRSLQQSPDILRAALYKTDGDQHRLFAAFGPEAPAQINPAHYIHPVRQQGMYRLLTPVTLDDNVIGYLLLDSNLQPMEQKLTQSYALVLTTVLIAIVLASWLALRLSRTLLQPLSDLRAVTSSIADTKDYSRRAQLSDDPELAIFIRSFNSMLDVIQQFNQLQQDKEQQILELNKTLEQKVTERTAQLEHSLNDLKNTQSALVERERLASLGGLVAGVAHEINTPVGVAMTAVTHLTYLTQHLNDEMQDGTLSKSGLLRHIADLNESALIILKNLERAAEQIRSFKMVAIDQSTEEAREFYLLEYLQSIVLSLRPQLKKGAYQVKLDVDPGLQLYSFPGIYSQIFTNLIMNSLIHGFAGQNQGEIRIEAQLQPNFLQLNYYDNGKGIDPKIKPKLWDPFVTSNRQQGGSGLGTYILYNLITQALKGRIDLVEDVPKGVHFALLIPLTDRKIGVDQHNDQA